MSYDREIKRGLDGVANIKEFQCICLDTIDCRSLNLSDFKIKATLKARLKTGKIKFIRFLNNGITSCLSLLVS